MAEQNQAMTEQIQLCSDKLSTHFLNVISPTALTMEEEEQLHIEDLKFVHDPQDTTMYVEWVEEDLHFSGFLAFCILFTPKPYWALLIICH